MSNYPKMLYKGNQEKYQTVIADDEDHEAELVADSWANYGELPEREQGMTDPYIGDRAARSIGGISVAEQNKDLQDQLATSQGEFIAFQNNVGAMKARIAELQGDTTPVGTTSNPESKLISLNDLTLTQLQEMAKSKGVEFKVRDSKNTLIDLIMDYQDRELASADLSRGE